MSILNDLKQQGTKFQYTRRYGDTVVTRTLQEAFKDLKADGMTKLLNRENFDEEVSEWLGHFCMRVQTVTHEAGELTIAMILAAWFYARCAEHEMAYLADKDMNPRAYQSRISRAKREVVSRF